MFDYENLNRRLKELESVTIKSKKNIIKSYRNNGELKYISYYYCNKLHREEEKGPAQIIYNYDNSRVEKYYQNDKLHRISGPAISVIKNGIIIQEEWIQNSKLHREDDLPAFIKYFPDQEIPVINKEIFYKNSNIHREKDLPALISYSIDIEGNHYKSSEQWYIQGKHNRINDNPTQIIYFPDGRVKELAWCYGTEYIPMYNRENDLPSNIKYTIVNNIYYIESEIWSKNGKYHRKDNPAIIFYYPNGNLKEVRYYEENLLVRKDENNRKYPPIIIYNENGSVQQEKWDIRNSNWINYYSEYDSDDESG